LFLLLKKSVLKIFNTINIIIDEFTMNVFGSLKLNLSKNILYTDVDIIKKYRNKLTIIKLLM
tara:strand:- start:186 stop:371 length:186 start_codon:yes stop_codon:yes gene_type:complete